MGKEKQGDIMKGLITAAGEGKRFGGTCKALLKIDNKYLIEFPLKNMKDLEIEEVVIITNKIIQISKPCWFKLD